MLCLFIPLLCLVQRVGHCRHANAESSNHDTQGRMFGARKGIENDPGYQSSSDAEDGFEQ
jgi:hypothetical protein